jgi:hypothetical protein
MLIQYTSKDYINATQEHLMTCDYLVNLQCLPDICSHISNISQNKFHLPRNSNHLIDYNVGARINFGEYVLVDDIKPIPIKLIKIIEEKLDVAVPKVLKINLIKTEIKKNVSRGIFFVCLSFICTSGFAQSPDLISYQTIIRNSNNELVANTSIGVLISILSGSEANVLWYQEEHKIKTNINGLAYIIIGKGSNISGIMSGIDWSKGPFYIKSETDPNGGKNYTLVVISQLLSVPYAIFAKSAENITGPITELDPQFNASISSGITAADTASWNHNLSSYTETDPLFRASMLSGITAADTSYWNKKLSSYTETDSFFYASISSGITAADTAAWNNNLSSYVETEPLFNASISSGITAADTAAWNNNLSSYKETDSFFYASISSGITAADTAA